jgi:hypothetical protein
LGGKMIKGKGNNMGRVDNMDVENVDVIDLEG